MDHPLSGPIMRKAWWHHQMETFFALLALCEGNPPLTGGFPSQRPVTRLFNVFFDLCLNIRLNKQWRRRWFEAPSPSLWRQCNGISWNLLVMAAALKIYHCSFQNLAQVSFAVKQLRFFTYAISRQVSHASKTILWCHSGFLYDSLPKYMPVAV